MARQPRRRGDEYIGNSGSGSFTQSGGTNTVYVPLLGTNPGASGTYSLSGGSLTVSDNEFVGNSGSGAFTQSGGTHTVTNNLHGHSLWRQCGTYNLSGGSLAATSETMSAMSAAAAASPRRAAPIR